MDISTTFPDYSKYLLWIDVPYRHSLEHFGHSIAPSYLPISNATRVYHVAMAIIKLIPVIGHVISFIHCMMHVKQTRLFHPSTTNPFQKGLEFGREYQSEIQFNYRHIIPLINEKIRDNPEKWNTASHLEFPDEFRNQMLGMASGANINIDDVYKLHKFLDAFPSETAFCSSIAGDRETNERITATNHSVSSFFVSTESYNRSAILYENYNSEGTLQPLQDVNLSRTVQTVQFDPGNRSMQISASDGYAADSTATSFSANDLQFPTNSTQSTIEMGTNLDWDWYFLDPVIISQKFTNNKSAAFITFPGYLAPLRGMNQDGLCFSLMQMGDYSVQTGSATPTPILLGQMLIEAQSTTEAADFLRNSRHGSSMNVLIADPHSAKSIELHSENPGSGFSLDEVASLGCNRAI